MAQAILLTSLIDPQTRATLLGLSSVSTFEQFSPQNDEHWLQSLQRRPVDIAIIELEDFTEEELNALLSAKLNEQLIIIFISDGEPNPHIDIAMQNGVSYHMRRPLDLDILDELLEDLHAEKNELASSTQESISSELNQYGLLIGSSKAMRKLYRVIRKSARTDASILIVGESGTGKELVANTLHLMSPRSDQAFVSVNCGAISAELVESELFGHIKGAFTGASADRAGVFEQAQGGTLFLDEITEMPLEQQVKLLRVLETGEYKPVGCENVRIADVRIVAACNRDPAQAIEENALREDLYFRIAHFPITVPPLRERGMDMQGLAIHFLAYRNAEEDTAKEISTEALARIEEYHWPGNVRELLHAIERAYILADEVVGLEHLILEGSPSEFEQGFANHSLEELEKKHILHSLDELDGNKAETAEKLGISVKTLYNKLKKYDEIGK